MSSTPDESGSSDKTDGEEISTEVTNDGISTIREDRLENCPACSGSDFEVVESLPNPVCDECGFVPGTEAEIPVHSKSNLEESESEEVSWREYREVTNSTEHQIATAFEVIESVAEELFLSEECRRKVSEVYAEAAVENLTDGRPTEYIVAAAVCIGTREAKAPRPVNRVVNELDLDSVRVKRLMREFQETLNLGFLEESPSAYLRYLCKDSGQGPEVEDEASELIEQYLSSVPIAGKNPAGIAAAALYECTSRELSQRQCAMIAGVSKETIRVRVRELREVGE